MMKPMAMLALVVAINSIISVSCKTTRDLAAAETSARPVVPPGDRFDFMGCRQNATGCDTDCTKKSGVAMEAPDICPKGGFEGHLACFCEKDEVR